MSYIYKTLYLLHLYLIIICEARELPSFIEKCKLNYPEVNECMLQRINALKPRLLKGIPELKLPPIDPLKLNKIEVETGNGGSGGFKASASNIEVLGIQKVQVSSINFDLDNRKNEFEIFLPRIEATALWNLKGKFFMFELNSLSPGHINITNIRAKIQCDINIVMKNKKHYVKFINDTYMITNDTPTLYLENIFEENQELTAQINKVLNDNMNEIIVEVKPIIRRIIFETVFGMIQRVYQDFSLEELFIK